MSPGVPARRRRARPRGRRSVVRSFLGRFTVALSLTAMLMAGAVVSVNKIIDVKLAAPKRVRVHTAPSTSGPINFLVLGADAQALDNLSDTMWVVRVDPSRQTALVVSFPRDLWVQIPNHGLAKINAANNGGPQLVIDTMKADFGVRINHYAEVNYATFQGVVNAIGTVPVYLPYPARDPAAGFYSPVAGCKSFSGYDALQYVRSRTLSYYSYTRREWLPADAVPDIDRIGRQQDFVRRLATLAAAKSRADPLTANAIVDRVLKYLTVDSGLSKSDVLTIIDAFLGVSPADTKHVQFETIPSVEGPNQGGQSVLYLREPEADPMIQRLGGTGIGSNPSMGTGSSAAAGGQASSTSRAAVPTTASGALHASIANQSALGTPAPRVPPC